MTSPALAAVRVGGPAPLVVAAAAGTAAGLAAVGGRGPATVLGGTAAVVTLQALGWQRLVGLLIAATFVTRFRIDVLGANLRPEHLVLVVCVVAMLRAGKGASLASAAADRTAVLFGFFVAWSAFVSVLEAPKVGESLLIVGWLALDWLMVVVLVAAGRDAPALARIGVLWAGAAAAAGVVLWMVSRAAGTGVGVATETLGGTPAASGLAFEPNLLGAGLALWAFVAFTGVPRLRRPVAAGVVTLCLAAIALSLTRAAMVGLGLGLVTWAALAGTRARVRLLLLVVAAGVVAASVVLVEPEVAAPVAENAAQALDFGSGTGKLRLESWRTAVADLDGMDWATGLGTNSFGQRHLEPTLPTTPTPAYLANLPLQVLYDTGVVGAALLAAVVASALSRHRLRDGRAVGLLVVYGVCAVATSPFWYGTTWLLVAIAVLDRRRRETDGAAAPTEVGSGGGPGRRPVVRP